MTLPVPGGGIFADLNGHGDLDGFAITGFGYSASLLIRARQMTPGT